MQQLKGFINSRLNKLFVENDYEIMLFVQTSVLNAGAYEIVDDCDELVSTLNEQIEARFTSEIHVVPFDVETQKPADDTASVIYLSIEPKRKIIRQ